MRNHKSLIGFGLIAALSVGVAAEQSPRIRLAPAPRPTVRLTEPLRTNTAEGKTKVIGTVVDLRQVRVQHVPLQLRDLMNGNIIARTESDDNGDYVFEIEQPGTYVVEMLLADGYVIALSNAGSLSRFETLQTVVQLPGQWDSAARTVIASTNATAYLGMTSAMTITSTTVTIAADQQIPPVSSGEPVSPR